MTENGFHFVVVQVILVEFRIPGAPIANLFQGRHVTVAMVTGNMGEAKIVSKLHNVKNGPNN